MIPWSHEHSSETLKRVVITGVGPITSIGIGKEKFWAGIKEKRSGIGPVSTFDPSMFKVASAAEVSDWKPQEFFPSHRLKRLDRYAQFAVAPAKLALDDSGLRYHRTIRSNELVSALALPLEASRVRNPSIGCQLYVHERHTQLPPGRYNCPLDRERSPRLQKRRRGLGTTQPRGKTELVR